MTRSQEQDSVSVGSPTIAAASLSGDLEHSNQHHPSIRDLFFRKGKRKIGVVESLRAIATSSWLNILVILIPFAWASHFTGKNEDPSKRWGSVATFFLSFFSILPLARFLEFGGEQLAIYLGKDLGDLIQVTLSNAVEATLAIILLVNCDLTLLKSTIIGVIILHLLLVPGVAFIFGGARIIQQDLHPHITQLNQSLLTVGVLAILMPTAFFSAVNSQFAPTGFNRMSAITDRVRGEILRASRGLAVLLLVVYICSRIYLHNPPGEDDPLNLAEAPNAPDALKAEVEHLRHHEPEVNQYVCIVALLIVLGLMATTAEWLVVSTKAVRKVLHLEEEWFGLILIPFISYAADGTVAVVYFIRHMLRHYLTEPAPPTTLARGESIDLSIQFALFWMPFLVLLAWWTGKPLTLLFDLFEVAVLVGACFLVNYVTADAKTNWAEGMALVVFYFMIALSAWYYTGQPEMDFMSQCHSVADALQTFTEYGTLDL
jgi:Ca2+:H+ antiporter